MNLCTRNTWRIDGDRRIEMEVLNFFQKSFPQSLFEAGFHISLSVILDKKIDLSEQFFYYFISDNNNLSSNLLRACQIIDHRCRNQVRKEKITLGRR